MLPPRPAKIQAIVRPVLALASLLAPSAYPSAAQEGPVVVYVVRHAERADDGAPDSVSMMMADDPPLSEAGGARARELAELLDPVGLTHIHSTDYERTRATARPVSAARGVEIELYDAADLAGLARRLRASPGTHLVVGHSDTGPALVEALGGDPGEPIEPLEYDRVHVVYILPGGGAGSAVFRYGTVHAGAR